MATTEALKKTLIAAKSVAFTDPNAAGTSGIYLVKVLEKLGIAARAFVAHLTSPVMAVRWRAAGFEPPK